MRALVLHALLLAGLAAAPIVQEVAAADRVDETAALNASQAAIGRQLGDYALIDSSGRPLRLTELRGRPLVLSFVYTSCYTICSGYSLHLRDVVRTAREVLGPGAFAVITVGFDAPNDTPARMDSFARERGIDLADWHFASGDAATIDRLTRDAGFTWFPSAKGYDHLTQTTIVDAGGRIVLQVYGQDFATPQLVEPLKRLVWGRNLDRTTLEGVVNSVRLFCTIYDPASGRYRFDYSLIVGVVAGLLALGMVGIAIVAAWRNVR